ncbi:MAG TPA: adenylate/guanylate cyclase domain-containing protein [Aliidongia sp.]|uniref:adenylate/guanylate cyclase domain-containing protein n=1 Tax=Aliidongia sp. TaxID=1914230 RepID=UPI002DDD1EE9|nr:adenylate/guanylate cyclase domain-containing protein [Aliidongia sp.]HEV2677203.1 adenylate/guanylate cyclase domain-containing protein [Aliidongia sp.]
MSITTRRKLASILLAMIVFALFAGVTTLAVGRPVELGITNAVMIGFGVGVFEEFYVQGRRGRWLRSLPPLRTLPIYVAVVVVLYLVAVHVSHLLLGRLDDLPTVYARLPWGLSFFAIFSVVGILLIRVAHFIGIRTLLDLALGTYHRPVLEKRVLLFLDLQGSTALGEQLGAFGVREFVSKFLFDVSKPITDHGGDIYDYTGDGLIASWRWTDALRNDLILQAIDATFAAVARERPAYETQFGAFPVFRIGVHGGDVVVSERGDTKRSIGIFGDAINIAARMEQVAKQHQVSCVLSATIVEALASRAEVEMIGRELVKGISTPIGIWVRHIRPG